MPEERELIPYMSSRLRGERLLVLAPHPDDEVIGCGGLIALHCEEKRHVKVVVVTDGSRATDGTDASYVATRESETNRGLELLGAEAATFLRYPDRGLLDQHDSLVAELRKVIVEYRPDLIAVTSPMEIHPDHLALARAIIDLQQSNPAEAGHDALTRIAFYEISQPFRPNTLVDISSVAARKYEAIMRHESQTSIRGYRDFAAGLNRYRSMTLEGCEYAEGYYVVDSGSLRTLPESELSRMVMGIGFSPPSAAAVDTSGITVIIRTRDRQQLLNEAISSVRAASSQASIVVVDDGSATPTVVPRDENLTLVRTSGVGRSEAMNRGVAAATTEWIAFLDDDDLFYPEHLDTLTSAAASSPSSLGFYTDAVSSEYDYGTDGKLLRRNTLRTYSRDFDPIRLHFDNYIPLNTLFLRRSDFLDVGGFDPAFDLFEDWDFLLRLTRKGPLRRIPKVTCEVRHLPDSGSSVLRARGGTTDFLRAKMQIWSKHPDAVSHEVIGNFVESSKQELTDLFSEVVELRGRNQHLELDVLRLERERRHLLSEHESNDRRIAELATRLDEAQQRAASIVNSIRLEMQKEVALANGEAASVRELLTAAQHAIGDKDESIETLYSEIRRLNGLLQTIYSSRTWQLHKIAERMRGKRG